jgi:hypothetical protein
MQRWLDRGYAAFSMTERGFNQSCGSAAVRAADPTGCAQGWIRLMDTRYEVRDAQFLSGRLVDEGLVQPARIGATGGSYGGGKSMALAALNDRVMLPDGSLAPWTSPQGTPMRLAAAAPIIPWTDLAYALVPNGGTLDYAADAPYRGRVGVQKQSLINGLYLVGCAFTFNFCAPPGADPDADLRNWKPRLDAGEPYDGDPAVLDIVDEVTSHHSSYYIDASRPPAPLLIANGFTDDLFPADEALRYYNRTTTAYPAASISLFFGEIAGHPRSQTKPEVLARLEALVDALFDHYLKGTGTPPANGVEAFTQTCPAAAPSSGPFRAPDWNTIAPGEVRVQSGGPQTISASGGDPAVARVFDPAAGGGACARAAGADEPGTANYRLGVAPAGGYTLLGSPTVIAHFRLPGANSQVAARLVDVAPDGQKSLVARGLWRPEVSSHPVRQVFQLHPNGWHFAEGHVAKLELLPADAPYGRASNDQQDVRVHNLELRLPVLESPGSLGGLVRAPAAEYVPNGYTLARGF